MSQSVLILCSLCTSKTTLGSEHFNDVSFNNLKMVFNCYSFIVQQNSEITHLNQVRSHRAIELKIATITQNKEFCNAEMARNTWHKFELISQPSSVAMLQRKVKKNAERAEIIPSKAYPFLRNEIPKKHFSHVGRSVGRDKLNIYDKTK